MNTGTDSRQILEIRLDGETVCLEGTAEGLSWLAQKCFVLIDGGCHQHIHLDDYFVLTPNSERTVLELFPKHPSAWESIVNKATKFARPDFADRFLEFRQGPNGLYIYGLPEGLRWLAQKCLLFADNGTRQVLQVRDYPILTKASKPATLGYRS